MTLRMHFGDAGFTGLNIVHVTGRGIQRGIVHMGRGGETYTVDMLPKVKIEVVVPDDEAEGVVNLIVEAAQTGNIGDGKIFLIPVTDSIRVRTGERGDSSRLREAHPWRAHNPLSRHRERGSALRELNISVTSAASRALPCAI